MAKGTSPANFILSEEILQKIWGSVTSPIFIIKAEDCTIDEINPVGAQIFSSICPDIIGRKLDELNIWLDGKRTEDFFKQLKSLQKLDNYEMKLRISENKQAVFLVNTDKMNVEGTDYKILMLRDISGLKQAEANARESEKLYESLVYNLPEMIIIHDQKKILFANEVFIKTFGKEGAIITGQDLDTFIRLPKAAAWTDPAESGTDDGKTAILARELKFTGKDGSANYCTVNTFPIRYNNQPVFMSVLLDITSRKNLEQYMMDKILESVERDRNQFAVDLHEDIGPTLSTIKLYLSSVSEMLPKQPKVSEKMALCMNYIDHAIFKLKLLSNEISPDSVSRFGLEKSLRTYIDKITGLKGLEIHFTSNIETLRFPSKVEINIYRIITELINNSLQHSGAGRAEIKLIYKCNVLNINYKDNGVGYDISQISIKNKGSGLINIVNRVNSLKGSIEFKERGGQVVNVIRINTEPLDLNAGRIVN